MHQRVKKDSPVETREDFKRLFRLFKQLHEKTMLQRKRSWINSRLRLVYQKMMKVNLVGILMWITFAD